MVQAAGYWAYRAGTPVVDAEGSLIGRVVAVRPEVLFVAGPQFGDGDIRIPTTAITCFDGDRITVNLPKGGLGRSGAVLLDEMVANGPASSDITSFGVRATPRRFEA